MTIRLIVATPVRGPGMLAPVSVGYSESLRKLSRVMPTETVAAAITFGCDVVRARNRVAALILREFGWATHVLWWDDDEWPEDVGVVGRMLDTCEDVIACPYTNKVPPLHWVHDGDPSEVVDARGLLDVHSVGFGFTITSTACLRKLSTNAVMYRDLPRDEHVPDIFGMLYDEWHGERVLLSEDRAFCKRWRDLGGRVKVYGGPGNIIQHAGRAAYSARDMGVVT